MQGQQAGLSLEQTIDIGAGRPVEPKLDALLAVARTAVGNLGTVDDQTWRHALDPGWTGEQLAERFVHIGLYLFTSYLNQYSRTDLDPPPAP